MMQLLFRFYEVDSWYKARIQRPELLPELHIIDPDLFVESLEQKMIRKRAKNRGKWIWTKMVG
jgi:hypothetical protein